MHSTNAADIRERLRREGKDALLKAVEAGAISAFAAAVSLGWAKRAAKPNGKPRERRRALALRAINGKLSLSQLQELWLGPNPCRGSLFASREELQTAWEQNKDKVMALWGNHGRRPRAFYEFEWSGPRPAYDVERSSLWRARVLTKAEKAELEAEWKEEFEHAQRPGFAFHTGGEIWEGERARSGHYAWADIPVELVERWTDERQATGTGSGI